MCQARPGRRLCHCFQAPPESLEFQGCRAFLHALQSSLSAQANVMCFYYVMTKSKDLPHLLHSHL